MHPRNSCTVTTPAEAGAVGGTVPVVRIKEVAVFGDITGSISVADAVEPQKAVRIYQRLFGRA